MNHDTDRGAFYAAQDQSSAVYVGFRDLRSLVDTNHLAVTHSQGQLANSIMRLEAKLDALLAHLGVKP